MRGQCWKSLPASERLRPVVLQVRLMFCTGFERWEMGSEVARVIAPSYRPEVREAAGRFHLAHAVALCGAGDVAAARAAVGALAIVWPEGGQWRLSPKHWGRFGESRKKLRLQQSPSARGTSCRCGEQKRRRWR